MHIGLGQPTCRFYLISALCAYLVMHMLGSTLFTALANETTEWQLTESFSGTLDELSQIYWLDGAWTLADGELSSAGAKSADRFGVPLVFTDFDLTVHFRVREYGTYGNFSIVSHELHPTESYYLRLNEFGSVLQRRHGYWEDYVSMGSYNLYARPNANTVHELQVSVRKNQITFSLNGGARYTVADSQHRYPEGMIWLRADNVDLSIEEFTITAPKPPVVMAAQKKDPVDVDALLAVDAKLSPTSQITGTWLTILEARELLWSAGSWDLEFRAMQKAGVDTIVFRPYIQDSGPLLPLLKTIFTKAAEYDMQLFIHTNRTGGGYQWTTLPQSDLDKALARAKQDMQLIAETYADHPAFAGWYIWDEVDEKDLVAKRLETTKWYYGELRSFANTLTPGKPMMIAPSFSASTSSRWLESRWAEILSATGINILAVQDSVGQGKSTAQANPEYYAAFARATAQAGATLWSDVEIFTKDYQPAPADRVKQQLLAVGPWVEKTLIFEFNHYMSPSRGIARQTLYEDYLQMLDETLLP